MKRLITIALALALTVSLSACSNGGVSREDYDRLQEEVNRLQDGANNDDNSQSDDTSTDTGIAAANPAGGPHIVTAGRDLDNHFAEVSGWQGIVAVFTGGEVRSPSESSLTTVGLKSDGTVIATGRGAYPTLSEWRDIIDVAVGIEHVAGLKSDGTVEAVGYDVGTIPDWQDVIDISAGGSRVIGLMSDGTAVGFGSYMVITGQDGDTTTHEGRYGEFDIPELQGAVAIAAGSNHTVGLKPDGTVVASGDNLAGECDVEDWRDITAIAAGASFTVGLKSDGTVVATGDSRVESAGNDNLHYNLTDWQDIVEISAGNYHIVGLKSDGTVLAVGDNSRGQLGIIMCRDVTGIAAGPYSSIVFTEDPSSAPPPSAPEPEVLTITIKGEEYHTSQSYLWLSSMDLTDADIEPLRHMTNLTNLYLHNNDISDLSPLAGLTNLVRLGLNDNEKISDLSPLSSLYMLSELSINISLPGPFEAVKFGLVTDLSPLSGMQWLSILRLSNQSISDLSPLSGFTNLTELDLSVNSMIDDWSPVAHVPNVNGRP